MTAGADRVRYVTDIEDSTRWDDLTLRPGDIVISARSKHGTTWIQMICALLIFQDPQLPAPLWQLSPWYDWRHLPAADVRAQLDGQQHRRFIKTHTPLDGLPRRPDVTYLVGARHPLDGAVSHYHHVNNIDPAAFRSPEDPVAEEQPPRPPLAEWLRSWIREDADPSARLDSLPGVLHHVGDAWSRRSQDNVVLLHYADLRADLAGQMRALAARLDIRVPPGRWPALVDAATFDRMRQRAPDLAPFWVFKNADRFFRSGRSGSAREVLDAERMATYHARAAELAPADLLRWLHRP